MFKITKQAAEQILDSVDKSDHDGSPLRIAARQENINLAGGRLDDGSIEYTMGFDAHREGDTQIVSEGVDLIFDETTKGLLQGATMDFVEYEPGDFRFIFLNPNDPHFVPPQENDAG